MDREQISESGVKYLLLAEGTAGLCILLPFVLAGLSLGDVVRSVVTGVLLWCLAIGILLRRIRPGQNFSGGFASRADRITPVFCAAGFWYFLAHTAVFARLWAELFRRYLTSVVPAAILCALPLAAGLVYLKRGRRFRIRLSRYAGIALLVLIAGLACLAGNEIPAGAYRSGAAAGAQAVRTGGSAELVEEETTEGMPRQITDAEVRETWAADRFARSAYEVFLCLGGLFFPLLSGHPAAGRHGESGGTDEQNADSAAGRSPAIRRTGCLCAATAGAFCIASGFLLTPRERWAADFPAVEAMRVLRPFGVDLGRLETVFVLLLLPGLAMTVAGGLWYVRKFFDYLYAVGARFYCESVEQCLQRRRSGARREQPGTDGKYYGIGPAGKIWDTEFAGELSQLPGRHRLKYYGIWMTKKLSDFPYGEKIRYYGGKVSDNLTAARIWRWIVGLTVYVLAVGFSDAFAAITFYRAYNMQILVPVVLIFYALRAAGKKQLQWQK